MSYGNMLRCTFLCIILVYQYQTSTSAFQNVALHKSASQIDTRYRANASLAVDGNTHQYFWDGGSCSLTFTNSSPYWFVDLGALYEIDHVIIYKRMDICCSDRLRDVELYIGETESTYIKVANHTDVLDPIFTFQLDGTVKGRWVKVSKVGITGYLSLCEVKVMAKYVIYGVCLTKESLRGNGDIIKSIAVGGHARCCMECLVNRDCVGVNVHNTSMPDVLACDLLSSNSSVLNTGTDIKHYVLQ